MATLNLWQTLPEYGELARKIAAENNASVTEVGGIWWRITASPKLVIRRSTFEGVFGGKPVWERSGLWNGLILSRDGVITKQAEDEYIIEDPK